MDADEKRANTFPDDYDTDLESEWANLSKILIFLFIFIISFLDLFGDRNEFSWDKIEKNRNKYQQRKFSNEINRKAQEITSLLTSTLNLHLNLGQNSQINTPEVFMSMETLSIQSLSNKSIENAQIKFPSTLNLTNLSDSISLRVDQSNSSFFE